MYKNIYLDIWDYFDEKYPFQIFVSGRGRGKTYSALSGVLDKVDFGSGRKFLLMRRTADEHKMLLDTKSGEGLNPYKKINHDRGTNLACKAITEKVGGIFHRDVLDDMKANYSAQVGYTCALSNFAGARGMDLSDVDYLIYDEFIPEKHIKGIKAEGEAFLQAVETIARNREIEGQKPLYCILLANSNNIYNPLFKDLGLVNICEKMIQKGVEHYTNKNRGLAIHLFNSDTIFTEYKRKTALYKLTHGSDFEKMALENEFIYNDFSNCGYMSTKGMRPVCALDEAYIYQGKGIVYISYAQAQCIKFDSHIESDIRRFKSICGITLENLYTKGQMYAEDYNLKKKILDIII